MSAEGPDSVPTSADPRSRRPTKKRALTPVSAQAASVDALFAKPDQDIRVPSSSTALRRVAAPPEIVTNVQGSSAGAGSGEFHVYKAARRREYERQREMEADVRREKDAEQFEREKSERDKKDDEKTRKNRERREKMKARKAKKGKGGGGGAGGGAGVAGGIGAERREANGRDDTDGAQRNGRDDGDDDAAQTSKPSSEPVGLVIHDDD